MSEQAMKRSTVEERKAYCKQHGHSWVKPYAQRRCSWCGEFEVSHEQAKPKTK